MIYLNRCLNLGERTSLQRLEEVSMKFLHGCSCSLAMFCVFCQLLRGYVKFFSATNQIRI
jgi:hypothetical protein